MPTRFDLQWLIDPTSAECFINVFLEEKPLIIKRNQQSYFTRLLNIDDLESLLSDIDPGVLDITMSHASEKIMREQYIEYKEAGNVRIKVKADLLHAMSLFKEKKATIIIHNLANSWPALAELVKNVSEDLQCGAGTNVFITPGNSQCFQSHFDENDLFLIQLYGKKRWKVFESMITLPVEPQNNRSFDFSHLQLLYDFELEQGDILYLPRGFVHEVTTSEMVSAHITLGLANITWAKLLHDFVLNLAFHEESLRKGYLKDFTKDRNLREALVRDMKEIILSQMTPENLQQYASKYFSALEARPSSHPISVREGEERFEDAIL